MTWGAAVSDRTGLAESGQRPRTEVLERIRALLRDGEFVPGARLPSERDMCARWDVNRSTLRSAIGTLSEEGVLERRHGSGTYVARPAVVRNLRDMTTLAAAVADVGRDLETRLLSVTRHDAAGRVADLLELPAGAPVQTLTRLRLIDGIPAAVELNTSSVDRFPGLDRYDFSTRSLYDVLAAEYGASVSSGRQRIGMEPASGEVAITLMVDEETAVFVLDGVALDEENAPVETFRSWVRPGSVKFASRLDASDRQ